MEKQGLTYGEIQQLEYLAERLGGEITYYSTLDQSGNQCKKVEIVYDKDSNKTDK
jgi:hypothetical protein